MDSVAQEKLLSELKDGKNMEKNLKTVNRMVGTHNSWERVAELLEKDGIVKEKFRIIADELNEQQCCGYATHVVVFIRDLVNRLYRYEEEAYDTIFDDVYYDNDKKIDDAIELLQKISSRMKSQ